VSGGTSSDNCPSTSPTIGSVTVTAKCGDLICEGTETNDDCSTDCLPATFEIEKSADPVVYIDSKLPAGTTRKSDTIKIKVTPGTGFNKNVTLSYLSIDPNVLDLVKVFNPITITSSSYTKGSSFYVNVPNSTTAGTKKILIKGVSSGTTPVERIIPIFLKVIDSQYENK
jgi:hypothetical protein